jgi:hypothetical protein
MDLEAVISWADIKGHVGLRFLNVARGTQEFLEKWLNQQMAKQIPAAKEAAAGFGSETLQ